MITSGTKYVILTTPLKWGLHINLHHVYLVRQPEACIGAQPKQDTFKRFTELFYIIPGTSTLLPPMNTIKEKKVINSIFTSKRFPSFDFDRSLIMH
mgnify:CR=1 FL=1